VEFFVDLLETVAGDVGINFSRRYAGMAEELLDDAEVGAVFHKVRGEAMAQHVGRDPPFDSGPAGGILYS
jgi:hypothetical protein